MTSPEIAQLQDQQALLTSAVSALLQGRWCGEDSAQAFVLALDPNLQVECEEPWLSGDEPPVDHGPVDLSVDMPGQLYSWTCSACALEWLLRAYNASYGGDVYSNREATVADIGYPGNINPTYGLMDGSGSQLRRVFGQRTGRDTGQGWLSFDQAYAIYSQGLGGMCSGGAWYHWVGIRGLDGQGNIAIANSAPGYQSVWSTLSRADWNRLGPFSCVWVEG